MRVLLAFLQALFGWTLCHGNVNETLVTASNASSSSGRYVDVRPGSLNLVISVPHGGWLTDGFEPRKAGCYSKVRGCSFSSGSCRPGSLRNAEKCKVIKGTDNNTFEMALELRDFIYKLTGRMPYFVGNMLARSRLDPNRQIDEATSMHQPAMAIFRQYHSAIENATREIYEKFKNGALVVDIHGHSHSHNFTELGYGIAADLLNNGKFMTHTDSSLQFLVRKHPNMSLDDNIINGYLSLGAFLEEQGMKALPSPRRKRPNGLAYFSGAFTVKTYGVMKRSAAAVQVEIPNFFRMTNAKFRYLRKLARGLKNFLLVHMRYF